MISVLALLALIGGEVYMQSTAPDEAPLAGLPPVEIPDVPTEPAVSEVPDAPATPPDPVVAQTPEVFQPAAEVPREDASTAGVTGSSRTTLTGVGVAAEADERGAGETSKR